MLYPAPWSQNKGSGDLASGVAVSSLSIVAFFITDLSVLLPGSCESKATVGRF